MEITRDVILDLLPLYLADEVSADTRAIVEKYLETDSALANIAAQSASTELPEDIPIPLTKEDKMEAYKEAKRMLSLRTIILALAIALPIMSLMGVALLAVIVLFLR